MHNDRLISDEDAALLVVAPDTLRPRIRCRAAEHSPKHLQRWVDPVLLVDWCPAVSLDAWNEQNDEDTLTSTPKRPLLSARRLRPFLRHSTINIDR